MTNVTLVKSGVSNNIYYIMINEIETGVMIKVSGLWKFEFHRPVTQLEYISVWYITQDEINRLNYLEKNK